ncbi:MAG TPA: helix-turn-helix transcriptional regulator [Planctomycetota bacterium]|nr:helix-turn-helix transcriptional regulator [Planctomycetota bacterium]
MSPREFLGELEEMVLLAVLRLGADAYGASVLRELDEQAGRDVPRGSVYVTLDRLEEKGLIQSRAGEPTAQRGGRAPRLVSVTAAGRAALRRTHEVRERLLEGLDGALGA